MPKTLTLRLDNKSYATFARAAKVERRSLTNLIETSALRDIEESNFVDAAEMSEILSDRDLLERLKTGSADAKRRRGRFVPNL